MDQRENVYAGLGDGRWEVRRASAWWLLRRPDAADFARLVPLLRDPKAAVRQAAAVALALAHGRREDEVVPLLVERALTDESPRVRRQVVSLLAWNHAHPDLEGFFASLAEDASDAKLATFARAGLRLCRDRVAERTPC
jgi:HEAT repeat protein